MALSDLGGKLTSALKRLHSTTLLNDETVNAFVKSFGLALLQADVDVKLVKQVQDNVLKEYRDVSEVKNCNKRKLLNSIFERELLKLVTGASNKEPAYKLEKEPGKTKKILLVGLSGNGKTTTAGKYALWHKRKGWKVAIICADTTRAGAFDQSKQNALKIQVTFYGSNYEKDAVKIVQDGLLKLQGFDMILIDTAGRNQKETELFAEMKEISQIVQPDHVVFVMDATIGRAIGQQAKAFADAVPVGSIILTKTDGSAKGGGALTAIAQTKSPIIFLGTGEHLTDFIPFHPKSFVQRLLGGAGDVKVAIESLDPKKLQDMHETVMKQDTVTYETMRSQLESMHSMSALTTMSSFLPQGMINARDTEMASVKMKRTMTLFDSMTQQELQSDSKLFHKQPMRVNRICRGSGLEEKFVWKIIDSLKSFAKMHGQMRMMGNAGMIGGMTGAKTTKNGKNAKLVTNPSTFDMKQVTQMMSDPKKMKQMHEMMRAFKM